MEQTNLDSFLKKAKDASAPVPDGAGRVLPLKHFSYGERTVVAAVTECGGVVLRNTFRNMLLRHCRGNFIARVAPSQQRHADGAPSGSASWKKATAKAAAKRVASSARRSRGAAGASRGGPGGVHPVSMKVANGGLSSASTVLDYTTERDDRAVGMFVESLSRRLLQYGVPPLHEVYCKWDGCHYVVRGCVGVLPDVLAALRVPSKEKGVVQPVCERLRTELIRENGCMQLRVAVKRVLQDKVVETRDALEQVVLFLVETDLIGTGCTTFKGGEMCVWFSARWLALDNDVNAMYKDIVPDGGMATRGNVAYGFRGRIG